MRTSQFQVSFSEHQVGHAGILVRNLRYRRPFCEITLTVRVILEASLSSFAASVIL